jgi:hypothetical protein
MTQSRKLVEVSQHGATIGFAGLGLRGKGVETPKQAVHDGDTIFARALSNISLRFLGVDAPEVSFLLPGSDVFTRIDAAAWASLLEHPFAGWNAEALLTRGLMDALAPRLGPKTALNHYKHADAAHRGLEKLVGDDVKTFAGGDREKFSFFLRYAHEALDRYGRLLAYVNADVARKSDRPLAYNERMLEAGLASPYFIWPNLEPFKQQARRLDAGPAPADVPALADRESLGRARRWVKAARDKHVGIFDVADPLLLQPFELRFLAQRRAPERWVVDLTGVNGKLIEPTKYHLVPNAEDRLFVPDEYVPLFRMKGWS